ncbi:hypothetical protein YC2023_081326 [Brassica napus]
MHNSAITYVLEIHYDESNETAGCRTAIYDTRGEEASSLTDHHRKRRRLQPRCLIQPERSNNSAITTYIALYD